MIIVVVQLPTAVCHYADYDGSEDGEGYPYPFARMIVNGALYRNFCGCGY